MAHETFSNIVDKKTLDYVNLTTLKTIRDSILTSFGPYGSATQIKTSELPPKFTKDGYTILLNTKFNGIIEESLKEIMEDLTRHVVQTVGDGTTSATLLSYNIYKRFITKKEPNEAGLSYNILDEIPPVIIEERFKDVVNKIKDIIIKNKKDITTVADIYKIAYVSTNGNHELANTIARIYKDNGDEVYIDVKRSNVDEDYVKTFDGMTLNTGYGDKAYINNNETKTADINNPHIYFFEDPIDTAEMIGFFQRILSHNIIEPAQNKTEFIPTVIVAPKVSSDVTTILDSIHKIMFSYKNSGIKLPFLFISDVHQTDIMLDIARLSGAKTIKKYINDVIQKQDQEAGTAPTYDNVHEFFGLADEVVSDYNKTKFINPAMLYKEGTTEYSDVYNSMVDYLKVEMDTAKKEGKDAIDITNIRRHYNALKANMVDLYIGGATPEERDSRFDSAEDAVLNCRNAVENGYGFGANFEGLMASRKVFFDISNNINKDKNDIYDQTTEVIATIIYQSYLDLYSLLCGTHYNNYKESSSEYENTVTANAVQESISKATPMDIRTMQISSDILSSINSDISVLEIISKLMTILINSKQFLCPQPNIIYKDAYKSLEDEEAVQVM